VPIPTWLLRDPPHRRRPLVPARRARALRERARRTALLAAALLASPAVLAGEPLDAADAGAVRLARGPEPGSPALSSPDVEVPRAFDWTGLYLGGHVGYGFGRAGSFVSDVVPPNFESSFEGLGGGLQGGYSLHLVSNLVLGAEVDVSFPNFLQNGLAFSVPGAQGTVTETIDSIGSLRARIGYGWGRWLAYGTGGFAWSHSHFTDAPGAGSGLTDVVRFSPGWAVGAGVQLALNDRWSARLEYLYDRFATASVAFATGVETTSSVAVHSVCLALDWWVPGTAPPSREVEEGAPGREWSIHGQATFVGQGYPSFHSPYEGTNSLSGSAQFAATVSATLFLGVRLWEGAALYFDPELMQGFGLSAVHGVASFPNGEAQKSDFPVPRFNVARIFLSQTFGLGGGKEVVEDGPNQVAGERDASRLTFAVGKFSTTDFFLLNAYAGGPRTEFLSWNVYGSGSYDQTMDKLSWTWGVLAELYGAGWAVRAGYFLLPVESNSNSFDTHVPQGQYMLEGEWRYALGGMPGRLLLTAWLSLGNMGSYSAALAQPTSTAGYPDVALTRQIRTNYGFVAGLEQAVTADLGLFARASFSPGQVEIMGWTDCDSSLSLGASWKGAAWGRPQDTLGVAGVVEGLSGIAREYFAAGGLGILIGDGSLSYRPEVLLESYYSFSPWPWAEATLDYQLVVDPGYNAARGPVSVFSVRVHVGF